MTTGLGLTVIVNDLVGPLQVTDPFVNLGVTVIIAEMGADVVLVAVNEGIEVTSPVLVAGSPMAVLLLVQV